MAYGKNTLIDNTKYFTEEKLAENKATFLNLLRMTKRENIENLIAWLETTDFFTAPSSGSYHLNCTGGLVQHALNVTKCLNAKNKQFGLGLRNDSIIICGLLHDACKINQYAKIKKVFKNDGLDEHADGKWYDYMTYQFSNENSLPLPHGTKSVIMIQRFINLTDEEVIAITHHMGAFEENWRSSGMGDAFKSYKLASALHLADMEASNFLEPTFEMRELPQAKQARLIEETRKLAEMELKK